MGQSGDIKQKSLIECALEAMANPTSEYRKSVEYGFSLTPDFFI